MVRCAHRCCTVIVNFYLIFAEFGVFLAEITVDPNGPLAIRQLASVLLKQYVQSHWSEHSDKFRAPETTQAVSVKALTITV